MNDAPVKPACLVADEVERSAVRATVLRKSVLDMLTDLFREVD